jgi:hypothetical protein
MRACRGAHPSMGLTGVTLDIPGTLVRSGVMPMSTDKQSYPIAGRCAKPRLRPLTSMELQVSWMSRALAKRASFARSMWHSSCV